MQTASLATLKKELAMLPHDELVEACIRIIKFKKENKELLNYLLFESGDEKTFIASAKLEMEALFRDVNTTSIHWAKKTIRKILRWASKYARYSGLATTHIELLIYFCEQMMALPLDLSESLAMTNLYKAQLKKIEQLVSSLHEDLHYDYQDRIEQLKTNNLFNTTS